MNSVLRVLVVAAALLSGGWATAGSPRSSQQVLESELRAGRLDRETWLLYRAYALFGDERLPEEYDGIGSEGRDETFVADVRRAWPTLSPRGRDALTPFIVRPNDPRSVFGPPAPGIEPKAGGRSCPTPWRAYTGLVFRGWICPSGSTAADDDALLTTVSLADGLYTDMSKPVPEGMGEPVPDEVDNDLDGIYIDIYIVSGRQCRKRGGYCIPIPGGAVAAAVSTAPFRGKTASGYLIVSRDRLGGNFRSDLAHEFFHVLQFAHNQVDTYRTRTVDGTAVTEAHWFVEASATWAEWQYVPESAEEEVHERFVNGFRPVPKVPLTSLAGTHEYASYIWPFFVQQERGGRDHPQSMFRMWKAIASAASWSNVNDKIDGEFPFAKHFGDFAVRNYNYVLRGNPIVPMYRDQDPTLKASTSDTPPVTNAGTITLASVPPHGVSIVPLAAQYDQFDIAGNVRKVTFDFRGLANREHLTVDALVRDTVTRKYRAVKSDDGVLEFCRDNPGEDVDTVILVLGNGSKREGAARKITGNYEIKRRNRCTCEGLAEPVAGRLRGTIGFSYAWDVADANFGFDLNESASSVSFDFTETGRTPVKPFIVHYNGTLRNGSVTLDDTVTEFDEPEDCVKRLQGSGKPHASSVASLVVNYTTCEYRFESNLYVDGTATPTGCSSNPTTGVMAVGGVKSVDRLTTKFPLAGGGSFPALSPQELAPDPNVEHYRVSTAGGSIMFYTGTQQGQAGSASVTWNFFDPDAPPAP